MTKISTLLGMIMILTLIILAIMPILNFIHPIYLIIMLLTSSMMICFLMSLWSPNLIYSLMLFMNMTGSLLIIFFYFASLIFKEKKIILKQKSKSSKSFHFYTIHNKFINIYTYPK